MSVAILTEFADETKVLACRDGKMHNLNIDSVSSCAALVSSTAPETLGIWLSTFEASQQPPRDVSSARDEGKAGATKRPRQSKPKTRETRQQREINKLREQLTAKSTALKVEKDKSRLLLKRNKTLEKHSASQAEPSEKENAPTAAVVPPETISASIEAQSDMKTVRDRDKQVCSRSVLCN